MAGTGTSPEVPLYDLRLEPEDVRAVMEVLGSGWLTLGPRTEAFEHAFAEHLGVRHAVAVSSCTAALHLAYLAAGVGPGRRGDRPVDDVRGDRERGPLLRRHAGLRRHPRPARPRARSRRRRAAHRPAHEGGLRRALRRLPGRGRPAAARCATRTGSPLIEDAAHAPSAELEGRKLGALGPRRRVLVLLEQDPLVRRGRPARHGRRRGRGARAPLRSHAMSPGLEPRDARHRLLRRRRPRLQLPPRRAALGAAALAPRPARARDRAPARADARATASGSPTSRTCRALRRRGVERSSCYVMPIMVDDDGRRDAVRRRLRDDARHPDLGLLSRRARVHGLPRALRRAAPAADRARRAHRDHDPALRPHRRADAGPRGRALREALEP